MTLLADSSEADDAQLMRAVATGDEDAYGVLWNRHADAARRLAGSLSRTDADDLVSEAFVRVLRALRSGRGPQTAFRPYLFESMRRIHIDNVRSYYGRVTLRPDETEYDTRQADAAEDVVAQKHEHQAALLAWQSLPESSRSLLWHLVVEEETPAGIAPMLGLSANGVSARAMRAREGLRQAFLAQHTALAADEACRAARAELGSYVRNKLGLRNRARVRKHLDECGSCRLVAAEITDLNKTLRLVIAPFLLGGAALAARYLAAAHHGAAAAGAVAAGIGGAGAGVAASATGSSPPGPPSPSGPAGSAGSAGGTAAGSGLRHLAGTPLHSGAAVGIGAAAVVVAAAGVAAALVAGQGNPTRSEAKNLPLVAASPSTSGRAYQSPAAIIAPVLPARSSSRPRGAPAASTVPVTPERVVRVPSRIVPSPPPVPSVSPTRPASPIMSHLASTPSRSPSPTVASSPPVPSCSSPPPPPAPPATTPLASIFDNVGTSHDADTSTGDLDGSGHSISVETLEQNGACPGAGLTHDGVTFTWPDTNGVSADNVIASGQTFTVSGSGSRLGFLVTSTYGASSGTGTISYTDGSTQSYALGAPDWLAGGGDPALILPYRNNPDNTPADHTTYVYFVGVDLAAGKTIASVTLPHVSSPPLRTTATLHVFAAAVGG